jgi:uncharacterized membrane protein
MTEHDTERVINRQLVVASIAAFVVMVALSAWAYVRLPAEALIPTSWTLDGQIDGYASKLPGLFGPVALFPVVVGVLFLVPKIEPRRINLARSAKAFRATVYAAIVFFAAVHVLIVASALGYALAVGRVLPVGVGALLVVIGNWLPKTRSNFLFGIRTPWTLSSDYTWRRTHRVGGRIFVALGLVMMIAAALLPPAAITGVLVGGAVVASLGLVVYSYVVWRTAPDIRQREG